MGRKSYTPTSEQKAAVEALSGYGIPQIEIANHLGINVKTLLKYFSKEISEGVLKANGAVVRNLHRLATKSDNPTAAIFWSKCRLQWKETERLEVSNMSKRAIIKDA